jgi:2-polyprenyl-3-methyl-5-hydroxy-6-metoxy-1,4-benzoquinol methylase
MNQWYQELFSNYADKYDKEIFTQGTIAEVDFIEEEIAHNKDLNILDVGCGTGRHSIELSKRGYRVTGLDLSEAMLAKARKTALQYNLTIDFVHKDARDFVHPSAFDLCIMLCEGAFPLMETDEMNYRIIQNISDSLKPNGKFIFSTLNGLFPLFHSVKGFVNLGSVEGASNDNTFDLMTFRDYSIYETTDDSGAPIQLHCNERYYVPSEISWLLSCAGFSRSDIYGCKLGAFSRNDKLTAEDFEMLVIAEK